jgi:hypothetical protein
MVILTFQFLNERAALLVPSLIFFVDILMHTGGKSGRLRCWAIWN